MRRFPALLLIVAAATIAAAKSAPPGRIVNFGFNSRFLPGQRYIRVWLPPQYDDPAQKDTRFPVLYLNDGQFIFHVQATSDMRGDWHADDTAAKLIAAGKIEPLIIVAIDNGGLNRSREYLPMPDKFFPSAKDPIGSRYPAMLFDEIMPFIATEFRALPDPHHTAIGGSSLGALIAFYAALERPGKVGKLLLESPSIWVGAGVFFERARNMSPLPEKTYIGIGTNEEPANPENSRLDLDDVTKFKDALRKAGLPSDRLKLNVAPNATHTESAWAARFSDALKFLFPKN